MGQDLLLYCGINLLPIKKSLGINPERFLFYYNNLQNNFQGNTSFYKFSTVITVTIVLIIFEYAYECEGQEGFVKMENSNIVLSNPLQQLKNEHVLLRAEMDFYNEITEEIEFGSGPEVVQLFAELYRHISAFTANLQAHSKREEAGLFPMMSRHLEENDKTIEVMEREHEKAEQHLLDFLTEAERAGSTIDEDDVQWITVYAVQAHATLTQHFAKEENHLFPLAENLLSDEEKEELERVIKVQ
jgi:regulator of cell morphogenesis and NO signaling